jgi:demethylmenaquinone methyltransferase/2-methoxy-6-polyprenyl-1,4-benzoquinol methylase
MNNTTDMPRETAREMRFSQYWNSELDKVFTDVAPYYDQANQVASLGLWNWFLSHHMSLVETAPGQRVLDLCAGTNAVGIALLKREPSLEVHALDRSVAMQEVGKQRAEALGFCISSNIGDVHTLPFPDNHFDIITLQWASRHLRIEEVMREALRVLKPGGRFHHCDMLRPSNPRVAKLYFGYLRFCLNATAKVFRSGAPALACRDYFLDALDMFYSAEEFSQLLEANGFTQVVHKRLLAGMVAVHRGVKPAAV